MAFNIAVKSKYNPFTYEDYIKPLEQYTKSYKEFENKLQDILVDVAALEPFVEDADIKANSSNAKYLQQYKDYITGINTLTDKLHTEGYNRNLQNQDFLNIRKAYRSQMEPLNAAFKAMKTAHAEENKLLSQGRILGAGAGNTNIEDFWGMNTPDAVLSLSDNDMVTIASEIATTINKDPANTHYYQRLKNGQYKEINQATFQTLKYSDKKLEVGISLDKYLKYLKGEVALTDKEEATLETMRSAAQRSILKQLGYQEAEYGHLDAATRQKIDTNIERAIQRSIGQQEQLVSGATPPPFDPSRIQAISLQGYRTRHTDPNTQRQYEQFNTESYKTSVLAAAQNKFGEAATIIDYGIIENGNSLPSFKRQYGYVPVTVQVGNKNHIMYVVQPTISRVEVGQTTTNLQERNPLVDGLSLYGVPQ